LILSCGCLFGEINSQRQREVPSTADNGLDNDQLALIIRAFTCPAIMPMTPPRAPAAASRIALEKFVEDINQGGRLTFSRESKDLLYFYCVDRSTTARARAALSGTQKQLV
jgi:hypothetical protein